MPLEVFSDAPKGFAVEFAEAVSPDGLQVLFRPVTFVFGKIVLRVFLVPLQHHPVARHLGNDGSGGNRIAELVTFWDGFLRDGNPKTMRTIYEDEIRSNRQIFNGFEVCLSFICSLFELSFANLYT